MIPYRKKPVFLPPGDCPQAGRERLTMPQPLGNFDSDGMHQPEPALLKQMYDSGAVFMMGQNANLPLMPERPRLLDFFHYRFTDIAFRHLLQSAKFALDAGQSETVVIACLLHDISNGALIRSDHGYWGAQMIAPYVSEEVAWACNTTRRCATSAMSQWDSSIRMPTTSSSAWTTLPRNTSRRRMTKRASIAGT